MPDGPKLPIVIHQGDPERPGWRLSHLVRDRSGTGWLVPDE
jgi:hypothetical protein